MPNEDGKPLAWEAVTDEVFDHALRRYMDTENMYEDFMSVPGVYELVREHYNNEVLELVAEDLYLDPATGLSDPDYPEWLLRLARTNAPFMVIWNDPGAEEGLGGEVIRVHSVEIESDGELTLYAEGGDRCIGCYVEELEPYRE